MKNQLIINPGDVVKVTISGMSRYLVMATREDTFDALLIYNPEIINYPRMFSFSCFANRTWHKE